MRCSLYKSDALNAQRDELLKRVNLVLDYTTKVCNGENRAPNSVRKKLAYVRRDADAIMHSAMSAIETAHEVSEDK